MLIWPRRVIRVERGRHLFGVRERERERGRGRGKDRVYNSAVEKEKEVDEAAKGIVFPERQREMKEEILYFKKR